MFVFLFKIAMSDYEEADFFMEPWTSPLKRKAHKVSKKNKKAAKQKKSRLTKTHNCVQKKKKKAKFKEAMMERKEKKKERRKEKDKNTKKGKKKKNELALNLDHNLKFTEGSVRLATCQNETLNSLPETSVKEPKRKKMVAFGSLPTYIRIKRPIFNSSPKQTDTAREGESRSQAMGKSQLEPHDSDFQCNSDEINSQDLFITQKVFRATPPECSSSEASDRVIAESPRVFTQLDKNQHTAGERKRRNKMSGKGQDGGTHQPLREIKTEDDEIQELLKPSNQAGEKAVSEHEGPSSFLDDPLVINPTPDAVSIKRHSPYRPYIGKPLLRAALANTSTQTENFFTTELSSYLSFHWKNTAALESQDMKPLDLSLPRRVRADLRLSTKMLDVDVKHEVETYREGNASLHEGEISSERSESMSASPQAKHPGVNNTTTSSEDDQHCRAGKRDVTQVTPPELRHIQSYSINWNIIK